MMGLLRPNLTASADRVASRPGSSPSRIPGPPQEVARWDPLSARPAGSGLACWPPTAKQGYDELSGEQAAAA